MSTEMKKKIYETVNPILDHQGQVHCLVLQPKFSDSVDVAWYDTTDTLIASLRISKIRDHELFEYMTDSAFHADVYDRRLADLIVMHSTYTNGLWNFYENWDDVEKVLETFTEYLVREFN